MDRNQTINSNNQNRQIKYDLLRAVGAFAIILVHSIPPQTNSYFQWWFHSALTPILLSFVGIYFMLSGVFMLQEKKESLSHYYYKRLISIVLPLFLYSWIYSGYDRYIHPQSSFFSFVITGFKNFINGTVPYAPHFWFMYTLIALYLCAPFLAKMVNSLTDGELSCLVWLMIISQGLLSYGSMIGIQLPIPLFTGWTLYFILGYSLKRLSHQKDFSKFLLLSIASLIITLLQKKFLPNYLNNIHDLAPTMIFIASGIFLLFEFYGNISWQPAAYLIKIIGKYSFSIYLIHFLILQNFIKPFVNSTKFGSIYLLEIISSAALTYLFSILFVMFFDHTIVKLSRYIITNFLTLRK